MFKQATSRSLLMMVFLLTVFIGYPGITNAQEDTQAPILTSFDFNPKVIDTTNGDQDIVVSLTTTDDLSGTQSVNVSFNGPVGRNCTVVGGSGECTVTIPQYSPAGEFTVHASTADNADNSYYYSPSELGTLGFPNLWVNTINLAPTAINDSTSVTQGLSTVIDLASNDTDPDDGVNFASIVIVDSPNEGSVIVSADGTVFYTHNGGTALIDSFTYTIGDNSGAVSNIATVSISINAIPTADAGDDQLIVLLGTLINLDGSQSYDNNGDEITYTWSLISSPVGSSALLSDVTAIFPSFTADKQGDYILQLIVTDSHGVSSNPDTVMVGFDNIAPIADAGGSQSVIVGDLVDLDGTASSDLNLDTLSYEWTIVSAPTSSVATIMSNTSATASFNPDVAGTYTISLTVDDGNGLANTDTIQIGVISVQTATTEQLMDLSDHIMVIDVSDLKNKNLSGALVNKINSVLLLIDGGDYQTAYDKLVNDIRLKTDGCNGVNGIPDNNDWVTDCEVQISLQQSIDSTLVLLQALID